MADKPAHQHPHQPPIAPEPAATSSARLHPAQRLPPHLSTLYSYFHPPPPPSPSSSASEPQRNPKRPLHPSMGPPPRPAQPMEAPKFAVSSLMSPPQAIHDSFTHDSSLSDRAHPETKHGKGGPFSARQPLPMSPPVSPDSNPIGPAAATADRRSPSSSSSSSSVRAVQKDPLLYPNDEHLASMHPQAPLFRPTELEQQHLHHRRIVDDHVRARSPVIFASGLAPPRRDEYELALTFRSQVMKHFTTNRRGWLRQERALLEADRRAGRRGHGMLRLPSRATRPVAAKPAVVVKARSGSAERFPRTADHGRQGATRIRRDGAAAGPARGARPAHGRLSATPEPSRRVVAPNREDKDFAALPDYCPSLDTLPSRANSLKVDWKGQPIDLGNDPHRSLLHPDEVLLAGNLRLDCATYLTNKRRIFERRLQCLHRGKEFRKTDAQQACKIDVNKASKLWTAYERVGWLDAAHVRRFL
ncbi:hypothetical protein RJ55_02668 [Drechmeria coniospora]|nr:hypothetical protein RJ55_02668 [Drechmeria coniospora]